MRLSALSPQDRAALPAHIRAILDADDDARAAHDPDPAQMQRELDQRRQGWREAQGIFAGATPDKHDASLYSDPATVSRPVGLTSTHPALRARMEARQDAFDPETRALAQRLANLNAENNNAENNAPSNRHTPTGGFAEAAALYRFDELDPQAP
jgi:hypothetical protein